MTSGEEPAAVFAYGTLMFEPVWRLVVGAAHRHVPAELAGYRRSAARDRVYPVVRRGPAEARVPGRLYRAIDPAALAALDRFEGPEYERCRVTVEPADGAGAVTAWAYVLHPAHAALALAYDWDPEDFERRHLAAYLRRHRARVPGPPR